MESGPKFFDAVGHFGKRLIHFSLQRRPLLDVTGEPRRDRVDAHLLDVSEDRELLMASLLGPDGSPVKLPALRSASRILAAGYSGASVTDPDLAQWRPPLWSAQTALSPDRPMLAARIHDLARNDGWASGGVTRQVDAVTRARIIAAIKRALDAAGIDMPFETVVQLWHDQTEETDGVRGRQREGWPRRPDAPPPRPARLVIGPDK